MRWLNATSKAKGILGLRALPTIHAVVIADPRSPCCTAYSTRLIGGVSSVRKVSAFFTPPIGGIVRNALGRFVRSIPHPWRRRVVMNDGRFVRFGACAEPDVFCHPRRIIRIANAPPRLSMLITRAPRARARNAKIKAVSPPAVAVR